MPMGTWTPRHLRKRYNNKSGSGDSSKAQAFKRAAKWSKRFIHQSYDALQKAAIAPHYHEWSEAAKRGSLR